MPICGYCNLDFVNVKSLLTHLKLVHNCSNYFKCGEQNCFRNFSNLNSFRRHLKTCVSHSSQQFCPEIQSERSLLLESKDCKVMEPIEVVQCEEDALNLTDNCSNPFHEVLLLEFKNILCKNVMAILCTLYADTTLSRKDVQKFIDNVTKLLKEPIGIFSKWLNSLADIYSFTTIDINILNKYVSEFENLFQGLETEYLRFKYLEQSDNFIKPVETVIGQRLDKVSNQIALPRNYFTQLISMKLVLKKFFELPNVLSDTLEYTTKLKSQTEVSNIMQTEFWANKTKPFKESDIVFPLLLYFDEYELGNPLGSHSGIHKLGAVYLSIPSIPIIYQSKLENIFLALLFHSSDLKEFGSKVIFSKFIRDCNDLYTNGISVQYMDKTTKIYFCLAVILGDNLALNSILGFTECFRANSYCRFCKCHRNQLQQEVRENANAIRDRANYNNDVELRNPHVTGIKEECVWNNIISFHATENYSVDIAHDIFEGVALFDFTEIFYQFVIIDKLFSVDIINSHIKFFNFGKENINKPPLLSLDNLKKKKIRMSCSEMRTLILFAGLMFGNLIPVDNKYWKLFIILRNMLAIILTNNVTNNKIRELQVLVMEHHSLYIHLFNLPLKPKHHNLLHYPRVMANAGPLIHLSTLRYESKHREAKLSANVVASRVNITYTLALKQQLKLCSRFLDNVGFQNKITASCVDHVKAVSILPNFKEICFLSQISPDNFEEVYAEKSIIYNSKKYSIGSVIYIKETSFPVFGIVQHIFINQHKEVCFVYTEMKTVLHNEHFYAYEVTSTELLKCILPLDIIYVDHLVICTLANNKQYITMF